MMKSILAATLFITFNSFAKTESYDPHLLIVKLKPGHSLPQNMNIVSSRNLFDKTYILTTNNLLEAEKSLLSSGDFVYVQKSYRAQKRSLGKREKDNFVINDKSPSEFNDPMVSQIWSFKDAAQNGVSVNQAYQQYKTQGTSPVIVAVVDTGVDYNHEDLKDVMWRNPGEIPNNGIDDDGNGYIDDVYGINVLVRDSKGHATSEIMDTHSHGTHVSGTIGAKQNNGIGIAGIASNVRIMGIRTVPNDGDEKDIDVAEAFVYAAKNGAKIINCSFGKYSNEGQNLIPDTLKYIAENYGVLVVAAAGNESEDLDANPSYPAAFANENLLVIASTTSSGGLSYFSNWGKVGVDVAAPGSNIYSTVPGNNYASMSGTSMATPTTVGVAAEVLAHHPNLNYKQLKEILIQSVTKVDKFKNKMVSGGRIDLINALELARKY